MKKKLRLQSLVRVTHTLERGAARVLVKQRLALTDAEARMAQLQGYREEYLQRLKTTPGGLPAQQMREYQIFLARLNDAVNAQQLHLGRCRDEYEQKRREWYAAQRRHFAADKIATRHDSERARAADEREQQESDDRHQSRRAELGG